MDPSDLAACIFHKYKKKELVRNTEFNLVKTNQRLYNTTTTAATASIDAHRMVVAEVVA